jgi:hypothetical protein
MTRRRKIALIALATAATAVAGLLTNSHWKVYGWVRGEPFWRGLPASYYAAQAGDFFVGDIRPRASVIDRFFRPTNPPFHDKSGIAIKYEDSDVIPVLLHMTHHPRTNVR